MPVRRLLDEGLRIWTPSLEQTLHSLVLGSAFHWGKEVEGLGVSHPHMPSAAEAEAAPV